MNLSFDLCIWYSRVGEPAITEIPEALAPAEPVQTIPVRDELNISPYKELGTDIFFVHNADGVTTMNIIDTLRKQTSKNNYKIIEELSDGFIIKMEW